MSRSIPKKHQEKSLDRIWLEKIPLLDFSSEHVRRWLHARIHLSKGWVYIAQPQEHKTDPCLPMLAMSNFFPGHAQFVKIGMTRKENPFERENTLNGAGQVIPLEIIWVVQFRDALRAERLVHSELAEFIYKKEFFFASCDEAKRCIQKIRDEEDKLFAYLDGERLLETRYPTFDEWESGIDIDTLVRQALA